MSWIEISDLHKNYGKKDVINGLDLHVENGINLILGDNGAGKSTLISIIEGLTRFKSGNVRVTGLDPRKEAKKVMERVSFIPESPAFFGSQIIQEYLNIYTKLNGGSLECLKYYMDTFGISDIAESHFQSLSKGETQLVQIAASLSTQKEYFVMDEPNSNLDARRRGDLSREIEDLRKRNGSSFLIVTHIVDDIYPISDRIYTMKSGNIKLTATANEVITGNLVQTVIIRASDLQGIRESLKHFNTVQRGQELIVKCENVYRIIKSLSEEQIESIISIKKSLEIP